MRIHLHIGLHKTATTFFQRAVFPLLDNRRIEYNPPAIDRPLREVFRLHDAPPRFLEYREQCIAEVRRQIQNRIREPGSKDLLLSHEGLSQYPFLQNYEENAALLHRLIPDAAIILFLRFQPDWLLAIYRQTVAVGDHQPIESFLNFHDGAFRIPHGGYNARRLLCVNALDADWTRLIDAYVQRFGRQRVHVFFFEDFLADNSRVIREVWGLLQGEGCPAISNTPVNPGLSAQMISLLVRRYRLLEALGLDCFLHTVQKERQRHLDKVAIRLRQHHQEQTIPSRIQQAAMRLRKRPKLLTRPPLIQRHLSGLLRRDRDLLGRHGMREILANHYRRQNRGLLRHLPEDRIPPVYLESQEDHA